MYHDILPNFSITPSQVKLVKETSVVMFHAMDLKRKLSKIIRVHIVSPMQEHVLVSSVHPRIFRLIMKGKLDAYLL